MWTGSSLVAWLVSLGINSEDPDPALRLDPTPGPGGLGETAAPFGRGIVLGRIGQNIPQKPDRLVVVTPTAGAPRTDQRLFKRPGFQMRVRGPARDLDSTRAELMALTFHERILAFPDSQHLADGNYLRSVQPVGGEPAHIGPRDTSERAEFFSNYIVDVRA